jgi:hypothetical protein
LRRISHRNRIQRLGLEEEEPSEQLDIGPDAQIGFTKGGKHGQRHHRICPNMMRLQVEVVQELPQEVARWQRKTPPEVLEEDNHLTRSGAGTLSPLDGRHLMSSSEGILRAWCNNSILFSFTPDPS